MCGRRGIWKHRPPFFVVGVALGNIDLHFVWQAWRLWCWAGSGGALGSRLSLRTGRLFVWQAWHLEASASILCGRRGAWQHRPSLCVAGVALMALGWLWWRAWLQLFLEESTSILCGRPDAWRHRPSLCVASVALMVLGWLWWHAWFPFVAEEARLFVWQAWQPSASAKNLLQTLRSHDTLRGLLGHIAHAAKTGGCHSPLLMARRLWLHNMITQN